MQFEHVVIDPEPPAQYLDVCLPTDLTGTGRDDVIIGGRDGSPNLFWYENLETGWRRHDMGTAPNLEAGGVLVDITGNGDPDIVVGQQGGEKLFWIEQPSDPRDEWAVRLITDEYKKYHDQAVGDVDGDGALEIVVPSQRAGVLCYYDIPTDPTVEPWPEANRHIVTDDLESDIEGIHVVDIDGDGENELVASANVFRRNTDGIWEREVLSDDWDYTRAQVVDIDEDGDLEILLAEGESPHFEGTEPARIGYLDPPQWKPVIVRAGLFCPHSFEVADFDDDGRPDIYAGEMGLGKHDDPRHFVFLNKGNGEFEEHVIARGIPTHEAKVANLSGDGRHDIVGKPYRPENQVDALVRVD